MIGYATHYLFNNQLVTEIEVITIKTNKAMEF